MTDADGADWPPLDTANTSQNWESFKKFSAKYITHPDALVGKEMTVRLSPKRNSANTVIRHRDGRLTLQGYTLSPGDTYRDEGGALRSTATGLELFIENELSSADAVLSCIASPMQSVRPTDKEWSEMRDSLSPENEEVLRRRIERARADIDEYESRLSWLASLPGEPEIPDDGDGPVVYFRKRFGDAEKLEHEDGYQYAAVRSGDRWWVTGGRSRQLAGLTWRELLAFIYMGETEATSPVIWIAVGWDKL